MKQKNFKLKQSQRPNRKRILIAIISIVIVLGLSWGSYAFIRNRNDVKKRQQQQALDESQTESAKKTVEKSSNSTSSDNDKGVSRSAQTSEQVPVNTSLTTIIDNFSQLNGVVNASARITGTNTSGTCVFSFTNPDDKPVVPEVKSSSSGNAQVCSVSIGESSFSKLGTWNLTVTFYQNDQKAQANQSVTIN